MLTPEYLQRINEGAEEIASQLHIDIINRIVSRVMKRIGRGEDYIFTATDKWQIESVTQAGHLLEDIQANIAQKTKLQRSEIKSAMEEAGVKALDYDDVVYRDAGLSPTPLKQSPQLVRLMQRNYDATLGEWGNYTRSTATAAQKLYIQSCDKAYNLVTTGAMSYTQAVKEVLEDIVKDGVKIKYPPKNGKPGHEDTIEVATARAVRTGIAQATGDIQVARMEEMGWDVVLTSAHVGARSGNGGMNPGNHLWWQGQFFSREGKTAGYPLFYPSTGYGTVEGLCGVNCRHSFGPGDGKNNPFADIATEDNYKVEQLNKRQRELERRIRKTKREVVARQVAVDECTDEKLKFGLQLELDKKSYLLQKQNAAYKDFCERNNLKTQQDRLRIAEWNRQTAAKASGAAKRYVNSK